MIEWQLMGATTLEEALLFLRRSRARRVSDAYPNTALVADRRFNTRVHLDDEQLTVVNLPFENLHAGDRKNVAIVAHCRELLNQPVGDLQLGAVPGVGHPDQQEPGTVFPGQIVGKGADTSADAAAVRGGRLTLYRLRLGRPH